MATTRNSDRLDGSLRDVMDRLDEKLQEHREHTDYKLDEIRNHLDERLTELRAKVDPMHDFFVAGKTGATILKWLVGILGSAAGVWVGLKGWFK